MGTPEIPDALRQHRDYVRNGFREEVSGDFGAWARGEQRADSDLGVLVDFQEGTDLSGLIPLSDCLGSLLELEVDVLSRRAPREALRPRAMRGLLKL